MVFQFFKNLKDKSSSRTRSLDLDKPSEDNDLKTLFLRVKRKRMELLNSFTQEFSSINLDSVKLTKDGEYLAFSSNTNPMEIFLFTYFRVGSYNSHTKIWTWDWSTEEDFNHHSPMIEIRNYGFSNYYEVLTKSRWIGSIEDVRNVVNMSLAIKKGLVDVHISTKGETEFYILINRSK